MAVDRTNHIREIRRAQGLSMTRLAARIEMDSANLSRYEREIIRPMAWNQRRILKGLGIPLKDVRKVFPWSDPRSL